MKGTFWAVSPSLLTDTKVSLEGDISCSSLVSPEGQGRQDELFPWSCLLECSISVPQRASLCVVCDLGFFSPVCSEINSPSHSLADLSSANLAMKNQKRQSR